MEESEPLFQATPSCVDVPPQISMRGGAIEGLQDEEGAPSEEEAPPPSNATLQQQLNTVFSVVGDMQRKMGERNEKLETARKENTRLMAELEEARLALASAKAEAIQASQRRQELQGDVMAAAESFAWDHPKGIVEQFLIKSQKLDPTSSFTTPSSEPKLGSLIASQALYPSLSEILQSHEHGTAAVARSSHRASSNRSMTN
uniref:Uncharacterized protein n=1 Tax=Chromera velia CCMP2878 TaxID=1169474 RepID=A0A0G4IDE2_9ALVE|eukprot:Cvel_13398.t1-p1 / transcript=Cvel_13398.t1 / gene=Cvel_13398 / organism=Chromera_velia_CCMP2878 / gene_product=hypothetical protein / transcript_product=hypothetical protein / location=Cvel_scaffold913:6708-7898(-) / protein_length=201 / sequence_SO=supercontig / SO=protein_coding / is_pseudo=false